MKRLIPVALIVALLIAALTVAAAEGVAGLSSLSGMDVEPLGDDSGPIRCDYAASGATASLEWTDGAQAWRVEGDAETIGWSYVDALALGGWETAQYIIDDVPVLAYEADPDMDLDNLGEYIAQVIDAISSAEAPAEPVGEHYVLNTNTMKFHYPSCKSVDKIKSSNRADYTGSREDLIARGYAPCGNCHP